MKYQIKLRNNKELKDLVKEVKKFISPENNEEKGFLKKSKNRAKIPQDTQRQRKIEELYCRLYDLLEKKKESHLKLTYLISQLAEDNYEFLPESLLPKIQNFVHSESATIEVKINLYTILGGFLLKNPQKHYKIAEDFSYMLQSKKEAVKSNSLYFLEEATKQGGQLSIPTLTNLIYAFLTEPKNATEKNKDTYATDMRTMQNILKSQKNFLILHERLLIAGYLSFNNNSKIPTSIKAPIEECILELFPKIRPLSQKKRQEYIMNIALQNRFNVSDYLTYFSITIDEFKQEYAVLEKLAPPNTLIRIPLKKFPHKQWYLYEFERKGLDDFFNNCGPLLTDDQLRDFFKICKNTITPYEIGYVIRHLLDNHFLSGGYCHKKNQFYAKQYILKQLENDIRQKGKIRRKKYRYLSKKTLLAYLRNLELGTHQIFLTSLKNTYIYLLKELIYTIQDIASKQAVLYLAIFPAVFPKKHVELILEECQKKRLILLEHSLDDTYLTALGKTKVVNYIGIHKWDGFIDLKNAAEEVKIPTPLLKGVLEEVLESHEGIFNLPGSIYYFIDHLIELSKQLPSNKIGSYFSTKLQLPDKIVSMIMNKKREYLIEKLKLQISIRYL